MAAEVLTARSNSRRYPRMRANRLLATAAALGALSAPAALAANPHMGHGMGAGTSAPAHLVVNGSYSDQRFIDMMVPHHMMAIEMAQLELRLGKRAQLKHLAREIVSSQQGEIAAMKTIRKRLYGSATTPTAMSDHEMRNMGMMTPAMLRQAVPFDMAFIDSMVPHHSAAIEMASVVLLRSKNVALRRLARSIVDAQGHEVGEMIAWRESWFGRK